MVDASMLLVAIGATRNEFIGALCLQVSFLAYLENQHAHEGRNKVPAWVWIIFLLLGSILYAHIAEIIIFCIASSLYAFKNKGKHGLFSPHHRGSQIFIILVGLMHNRSTLVLLPLIAYFVIFIRNTLGDFRDVEKDRKQGMLTIPIALGVKKNWKHGHLIALLASTAIWWSYTDLSFYWFGCALIVEFSTYNLTPR